MLLSHRIVRRTLTDIVAIGAALACMACRQAAADASRARGRADSTWSLVAHPVTAAHAMVASNSTLASGAGVEVLRAGGNAVDAAVATGFALAVTHPEAGNIGGGGYMVIRMADGRTAALDYREIAPLGASRDMFIDSAGHRTRASTVGYLASGVPGSVAGLTAALARYGTLPLSRVMAPAVRLAEKGFVVDSFLASSVRENQELIARFGGRAVFLPHGTPIAVGDRLVQADLARTLRRIASGGSAAFYRGVIARQIADEMSRGAGLITRADLSRYAPVWREPLRGTYRGYTLLTMPPSSSGGVTLLETLNVLEATGPPAPAMSERYLHRVVESLRRAFVDRNTRLGDPAFVANPIDRLTSKEYARALAAAIDSARATPTADFEAAAREGTNTTHYSVVDAHGNAVATTTTLNDLYGSGVYVQGAGFFLNDEMDDFTARPGVPNSFGLVQGASNAIAPGKRMLSAMAPTIVLDSAGQLALVLGSRGGPRIITSVLQVLLGVIDGHLSLGDAMAAPRIHHQAWPDTVWFERHGVAVGTLDSLAAAGYALAPAPFSPGGYVGRVIAVARRGDQYEAVVDPRTSGGAIGY